MFIVFLTTLQCKLPENKYFCFLALLTDVFPAPVEIFGIEAIKEQGR